MIIFLFVLLGICTNIIIANSWFIVPDYIPWICFGFAGIKCLFEIVCYFFTKNIIKKF